MGAIFGGIPFLTQHYLHDTLDFDGLWDTTSLEQKKPLDSLVSALENGFE